MQCHWCALNIYCFFIHSLLSLACHPAIKAKDQTSFKYRHSRQKLQAK